MESFRDIVGQFFSWTRNTRTRTTPHEDPRERATLLFPPIPVNSDTILLRMELQRIGGDTRYTRNLPYTTGFPSNPEPLALTHPCPVVGLPSPRVTPEGVLLSEILRMPPKRGMTLREMLSLLVVTSQNLEKILVHLPPGCLGIKESLILNDSQLISLCEYGYALEPGILHRTGRASVMFQSNFPDRPSQRATDRVNLLFADARNDWNKFDLQRDRTAKDSIFRRLIFQIFSGAGPNPVSDAAGWIDTEAHHHLTDALALFAHYSRMESVSVGQSVECLARVSELEPVVFYDSENNVVNDLILQLINQISEMEEIVGMEDITLQEEGRTLANRKRSRERSVRVALLFDSLLRVVKATEPPRAAPAAVQGATKRAIKAPAPAQRATIPAPKAPLAAQGAPTLQPNNKGKGWNKFKFAPFANSNEPHIPVFALATAGETQAAPTAAIKVSKDIRNKDSIEELINSLDDTMTKLKMPREPRTYPAELQQLEVRRELPPERPQPRGEWVAKLSRSTGKYYWYNKRTKQSTWDLPSLHEVAHDAPQQNTIPGAPTAPPCPNDLMADLEDSAPAAAAAAAAAPNEPPAAAAPNEPPAAAAPNEPPAAAVVPLAAPALIRSSKRRMNNPKRDAAKRPRRG